MRDESWASSRRGRGEAPGSHRGCDKRLLSFLRESAARMKEREPSLRTCSTQGDSAPIPTLTHTHSPRSPAVESFMGTHTQSKPFHLAPQPEAGLREDWLMPSKAIDDTAPYWPFCSCTPSHHTTCTHTQYTLTQFACLESALVWNPSLDSGIPGFEASLGLSFSLYKRVDWPR